MWCSGLLQSPPERWGKSKYFIAAACEFFANIFFAFVGSLALHTALSRDPPDVVLAGLTNGMALALAIYGVANCSGGHITPSVTLGTMITGHCSVLRGLMYMFAQLCGCCFGSLLVAGLVPDAYVGMGNTAAAWGCFEPHTPGLSKAQLFGIELIISFILVYTAYAVAIGEPNFGNVGPFVVGLSLAVDVWAAATFSGSGVHPWRVFGPSIVFHCRWDYAWVYLLGDFAGGAVAGLVSIPLYGSHAPWLDKLMPWSHHHYPEYSQHGKAPPAMEPDATYVEDKAVPIAGDSAHNGRV